jgi:hypothetical protein
MKWINFVDGLQSTIILSGFEIIFDISDEVDGWRLQITLNSEKMEADNYDYLVYEKKGLSDLGHAKREAYNWLSWLSDEVKKYVKVSPNLIGQFICIIGDCGFAVIDGQGRRYDRKDGEWILGHTFSSPGNMLEIIGKCVQTTEKKVEWCAR